MVLLLAYVLASLSATSLLYHTCDDHSRLINDELTGWPTPCSIGDHLITYWLIWKDTLLVIFQGKCLIK